MSPAREGPGQSTKSAVGASDRTGGRRPAARGGRGGERRMVEPERPRSYAGRPIVKEPVWTWEIPTYFFVGGLAGGSAVLGVLADATGQRELGRRAWPIALGAVSVSPVLLISDLGRPERFYNMLRVVKPTSPMSVGSWILSGLSGSIVVATAHSLRGWFPRLGPVSEVTAGLLGPMLSTYTAVLIANTSVPVWHEARRELPFVFAASSAASAGAAAGILAPSSAAGPARRLAVLGAAAEIAVAQAMERRLGEPGEAYRQGTAGKLSKAARALTAGGAGVLALAGRRSRAARIGGGALVLAGAATERWAIFKAGFQSARDPEHTVGPQRQRLAAEQR